MEDLQKYTGTITRDSEPETHKEKMLRLIAELPIEEGFEPIEGMFIPLASEVILLPVQQDSYKSKNANGLILPTTSIKNMLGIVYAFGPGCNKPFKLGMKVLFEPKAIYLDVVAPDGRIYLLVLDHNVYCAVPPDNYVLPTVGMIPDKIIKRNEERREGMINAAAHDKKKMDLLDEKAEHTPKTISIPK